MILRSAVSASPETPQAQASEQARTSRFLEPYRFDADQRSALLAALQQQRLGDDSSRRLFVAALEYEIGAFRQMEEQANEAPDAPQPTAADSVNPELERMRQAAITLRDLMLQTPEHIQDDLQKKLNESDLFCRIYDTRYLKNLRCEIERIATACELLGQQRCGSTPPEPNTSSAELANGRRLVRMLAHTYSECFDAQPSPESKSPFGRIVDTVIELTGIAARCNDSVLRDSLAS